MDDSVIVDYQLKGAGWAQCDLTVGKKHLRTTASYLSDALGDLARATVALANGATEARASFAEEPGEYRWILRRERDDVEITVLWFEDFSDFPDSDGTQLFQERCAYRDFVAALDTGLDEILRYYGVAGYRKSWIEHDFPVQEHQVLKQKLSDWKDEARQL